MSLINELLRKNLSTESAVDDSKIGGGPDATTAQPAPEIGSAFEEEAHGTKHDTPGAETVTTAAGEEVPAAAAESQEPTQSETTAGVDTATDTQADQTGEATEVAATDATTGAQEEGNVDATATDESAGVDTSGDSATAVEETATQNTETGSDTTAAVTEPADQTSSEESQNEPASETNDNSSDDGLGSTDGSSDTGNEPAAENAGSDESDAGAGAEADPADSEAGSSEPQPDTENPDNLDPVKELPNPEEESDLKPEVQEAESEGEDAEIAPDTETDDELAEKADLVAGYADAKQSLEEIVETITDSLADGGLTPEGMASAQGATNDVLSSIGEAEMGLPSAESLQTLIGRRENTKLVLESITEKAKAIGKKIWRALVDLIDRLLAKFTGVESMIKDFDTLEQQLNDLVTTKKVDHPTAKMDLGIEHCRALGIKKNHDSIVATEWSAVADWLPKATSALEKQLAAVASKLNDPTTPAPDVVDVGTVTPPASLTLGTDVAEKATVAFTPKLMLGVIRSYSKASHEVLPHLAKSSSMDSIRKFAEHQLTKVAEPTDEEKAKVKSLVGYIPQAARFQSFVRNNIAVTRLFCHTYLRVANKMA